MRRISSIVAVVFLLFTYSQSFSQKLPVYMTEQEKAALPFYTPLKGKGIATAPTSPLRNPAEWEEMDAVLIAFAYYENFLTEIIRYSIDESLVYLYVDDSSQTKNYLSGQGIDLTNVRFIQEYVNSVWIRDYGPNNVYTNDVDSLLFIDWVYNRNRPADDTSPGFAADAMNIPMYEMTSSPDDLVATGGNFMSDGFGTAFSSELIVNENATVTQFNQTPKSVQDIKDLVNEYLGITEYILMPTLPYDGIHHLDMHMKLLDEETLMVGYYPTGVADGPQIDSNLNDILNNYNSCFGTPFKVVRIPMPPSTGGSYPDQGAYYRTYTNSLILNKSVLVPTYYEEYDTTALRIYREAMPGYRIVGINANEPIPASGTIHCTTHEVATKNPLLISHQGLTDQDPQTANYTVSAKILHRTGISSASVYFKNTIGGSYSSVSMNLTDAVNNIWTGEIPGQTPGDSVYYYIEANSVSGKQQVRPMPAPEGYWAFRVLNTTNIYSSETAVFDLQVLYPELASQNLVLEVICEENTAIDLQLFNSMGQKVRNIHEGNLPKGRAMFYIPAENLGAGMYYISGASETFRTTKKFFLR